MFNLIKAILANKIQTRRVESLGAPGLRGELSYQSRSCTSCGKCVAACPVQAIELTAGAAELKLDYTKCLFCGRCVEACEELALQHTAQDPLAVSLNEELPSEAISRVIKQKMGRSLHVRHLDCGSCNACDFEMGALSNPVYDLHRYGIAFVASPRHADVLMVTGTPTRNLERALHMAYEAMPEPKLVMAVGACAGDGGLFTGSYAVAGSLQQLLPVDIVVPGCPPRPSAMILALVAAAELYQKKCK